MVWCASFDIGKINFAFYIEEFDKDELPKIARARIIRMELPMKIQPTF